jgi:predicted MFS family arabinose efflux permease
LNPDEPKQLEVASFAAHSTRGLLRDRKMRRRILLAALALALVFLAFAAVIDAHEHLLMAVICWAVCAWMTMLTMLLALYDLLVVRREARAERERLSRPLE